MFKTLGLILCFGLTASAQSIDSGSIIVPPGSVTVAPGASIYSFGNPSLEFRPDGSVLYAGRELFRDQNVYADMAYFMEHAQHLKISKYAHKWQVVSGCPSVRIVAATVGQIEFLNAGIKFTIGPGINFTIGPEGIKIKAKQNLRIAITDWTHAAATCHLVT